MTATVAEGVAGVIAQTGNHLGYSDWMEITQDRVNLFADATGDHQWIHVDPERAKESPFGGPIAHGHLTLSLAPILIPQIVEFRGFSMGVNYGCDRVRFPAPVPVGARLRAGGTMDETKEIPGGVQVTLTLTYEVEGSEKPACVATLVLRYYV